MGVILNRPLRAPTFTDLMRQLEIQPIPPRRELPLGTGGPVDDNRGFVLHSADWADDGSLEVDGAHVLTANLSVLHAVAEGGGPQRARLVLGYAGWGAGQLDEEIRENAWLSTTPDEAIIFDTADETKWQRALANLRIDPGKLSGLTGRA